MSRFGVRLEAQNRRQASVFRAADRWSRHRRRANRYDAANLQAGPTPSQIETFPALQGQKALLYAARRERLFRLFLGSSAVEHSTVNRMVAGSNPARGAIRLSPPSSPSKELSQAKHGCLRATAAHLGGICRRLSGKSCLHRFCFRPDRSRFRRGNFRGNQGINNQICRESSERSNLSELLNLQTRDF
jgi:hypothetical protein